MGPEGTSFVKGVFTVVHFYERRGVGIITPSPDHEELRTAAIESPFSSQVLFYLEDGYHYYYYYFHKLYKIYNLIN